jgi:hypothetical protein
MIYQLQSSSMAFRLLSRLLAVIASCSMELP